MCAGQLKKTQKGTITVKTKESEESEDGSDSSCSESDIAQEAFDGFKPSDGRSAPSGADKVQDIGTRNPGWWCSIPSWIHQFTDTPSSLDMTCQGSTTPLSNRTCTGPGLQFQDVRTYVRMDRLRLRRVDGNEGGA